MTRMTGREACDEGGAQGGSAWAPADRVPVTADSLYPAWTKEEGKGPDFLVRGGESGKARRERRAEKPLREASTPPPVTAWTMARMSTEAT